MAEALKRKNHEPVAHYDKKSDVLYLGLKKGPEESFVEVAPGVNVEMDANEEIIGIEILRASQILDPLFAWRKKYAAKFSGWDSTAAIREARDKRLNRS